MLLLILISSHTDRTCKEARVLPHGQASIILINLLTSVIVETFEKAHLQDAWKLSPSDLEGAAHTLRSTFAPRRCFAW
jgi:hypothetical protein